MAGQKISQAVAEQQGQALTLAQARAQRLAQFREFLAQLAPELARALPAHMTAERLTRITLTQARNNMDLLQCTDTSLAGAVLTCAQLGMEPGPTGEAYFIPRRNKQGVWEAHFELGYKGMAALFWRHPLAAYLKTETVRVKDFFDFENGTEGYLRHKPASGDRGEPRGQWYAVFKLVNGGFGYSVLDRAEVQRRRRSSSSPNGFGWTDNYDQMAEKSALRDMFDLMPKLSEITRVLAWDGQVRRELDLDAIDTPPEHEPEDLVDESADDSGGWEQDGWPAVTKPGTGGDPA